MKPTAGNIADTLYINRPLKFIRSDALFNLLCLANIHYFSKVIVNDFTNGVILGAVLERTSQSVTSVYTEKIKDHALKYFGISKKGNEKLNYSLIENVNEEFDSMIVAVKDGLLDTFKAMYEKLKGSGCFVAFQHDAVEAAVTYDWLMTQGIAANVVIEEIWSREFQVLPERTHPDVKNRIGTSAGYIVSGIKIVN